MNRRSFLTTTARVAATGAALAVAANAPRLMAQPQEPTSQVQATAPAPEQVAAKQPTRGCNKPLRMYASHRSIRSASLWALMMWWGQYGAGVQAHQFRAVPRSCVREMILSKYCLVAEEHIYG